MQVPICRHIRPNGLQCQAVALKNQVFCYFHHRLHRSHRIYRNTITARPDLERRGAIFDLGTLEDSVSIQIAISKVVNAIATNMLDLKHGRTILYGLHLAATNARRLNPIPEPQSVVRELTTIGDPEDRLPEVAPEGATTDLDLPEPVTPPTELVPKPTMLERILEQERTKSEPEPAPTAEPQPESQSEPEPGLILCAAAQPSQPVRSHPCRKHRTRQTRSPHRRRPTVQSSSANESNEGRSFHVRHKAETGGRTGPNPAGDCADLRSAGSGRNGVGAV